MFMDTMAKPALKLFVAQPRVKQLQTGLNQWALKLRRCKGSPEDADGSFDDDDTHAQTLKLAAELQSEVVGTISGLVTSLTFGPVAPLLLVLAPIGAFSNWCAEEWLNRQRHSTEPTRSLVEVARQILVQCPSFQSMHVVLLAGNWVLTGLVFFDFDFSVGPILTYCGFNLVLVCVLHLARRRATQRRAQVQTAANVLGAPMSNEQHATNANWDASVMMNPLCHESALAAETSIAECNISGTKTAQGKHPRHRGGQENGTEVLFTQPKSATSFIVEQARGHSVTNATEVMFVNPN